MNNTKLNIIKKGSFIFGERFASPIHIFYCIPWFTVSSIISNNRNTFGK